MLLKVDLFIINGKVFCGFLKMYRICIVFKIRNCYFC